MLHEVEVLETIDIIEQSAYEVVTLIFFIRERDR